MTIYLREGKYILDKPIVLTPENSCDSKTLTIKAYPEENVVLSSGISLNLKWEKYKKGIMRASVSGNPIMDMLIVNGNIRHMARFPNYDKEAVRFNGTSALATDPARVKKWKDPERFDIVIFKYPDDESKLFIKRVIGLPGEKVQIKDGKVYINDSEIPLDDSFVPEKPRGSFGPYEVPENSYFVLGDNRNHSKDSRCWKSTSFVTFDEIVGKAVIRYYPSVKLLK